MQTCYLCLAFHVFELFDTNAMLYQVCYWASLLCQKSHTNGIGYMMQTSKFIILQIMHYGKNILRS